MILLENSIASTKEKDSILVKLKCNDITSPYATIEVVDTGKGILNSFQPPIPNPKTIQQAQHNSQSPVQIGLYNLKQILSKIGPQQDIILKSTKDVGTKISFKIYRDLEYKDSVYWGKHEDVNRYSIPILPQAQESTFAARTDNKYRSMIPIQNDNQIQEESQQLSDESIYPKDKSKVKQLEQQQNENSSKNEKIKPQKCKTEESPNRNPENGKHSSHNIHNNSFNNINLEDTLSKLKSNTVSPNKPNISILNHLHSSSQMINSSNQDKQQDSTHIKCVSIQEGLQLTPSKSNNSNSDTPPNKNNIERDKNKKSILKRPKILIEKSENCINLNNIFKNDEFEQDSDLDSDIFVIEIEEFPNHSPDKSQPFEFIKRTQKEKRLSHITDISRVLTPQNMPSTNAFSNSRLGYEQSPKNLINRHVGRNSTLNFTEIERDF